MGLDSIICGNCRLRGGNGRKRSCYVVYGQAPQSIWRKYQRGGYAFLPVDQYADVFSGRVVRFGSYGDPALIPLDIVRGIASVSAGWTGYTHPVDYVRRRLQSVSDG